MDQKLTMLILVVVLMSMSVNIGCATVDKDKEKCANDLIGLATCLPYVSGESRSPPIDCCSGLKQVLQKSPECICLLVKDRNDPSLGLTINATLALSLPSHCHAPNATISDCPALLHLAPNSPDAKVFEDFAKSGNKTSNATSSSTAPTAAAATADNKSSDAAGINRRIITAYYFLPLLFTIMSLNSLFTQL